MTPTALNLKQRRYVESVLAGLPHLAQAVAAISLDWQPAAFQAAERSYLKAFRQLGLSGPQTWASSVMRRLRRRVREAEKEKLTKLYEQLSAGKHGSAVPFGQAHSFVPHPAALSQYRKNVGGVISIDEQIGDERSFATQEAALSEYQRTARGELSADEQIGEEHSFAIQEAASSEEQNAAGEPSANEQIGEERSFPAQEVASSEEQNAAGELSADEQMRAHSFATHEAGLSEEHKNVARESVKKDAVVQGMARIMIRVDEIFDDGRHPMVDKQSSNRRTHSDSSKD